MNNPKKRRYLTDDEAKYLGLELNSKQGDRDKARYWITTEQYNEVIDYRSKGVVDSCKNQEVDVRTVKHLWKKDGNSSLFIKNPLFVDGESDFIEKITDSFNNVLENYIGYNYRKIKKSKNTNLKAIKATTSDDHVGLEPDKNKSGLFKYEYNGEVYKNSIDKVYKSIIKEKNTHNKFDLLLLDNLGDEQDGWNGQTVRGGHSLDQNMTNDEVFDVCVDTKVNLIINLVESNVANEYILRKVVNDNHSGDFGHIINKAVSKIINRIYKSDLVIVESLTRFLEHRFYGDHCFILTHGKDMNKMKRGLPLQLDDKTINFINDYISFYNIKSKYIHVEKGDLHQVGYNKCSFFDYRNFMSLAPPSNWVQHNFGDSYSGYSIQVIPKNSNEISHTDYFIDYRKINK